MKFIIDTFIWDEKEILDISIYDGEGSGIPWHEYVVINPLKNLRFTLITGTKELSLMILGIIESLSCVYDICLFKN